MKDEIIFREVSPGKYSIEASYNADYVEYIKSRVPRFLRHYDEDTQIWTIQDDGKRLNALESVAVQKFQFAQRQYRNKEGKLVLRNLKTGMESVIG